MKIAIINTFYKPESYGGAEKVTEILVNGLQYMGHEVVIITTGLYDSIETVEGVKIYRLSSRNVYDLRNKKSKPAYVKYVWHLFESVNPLISRKIRQIITTENIEIVNTHNLYGLSWDIFRECKNIGVPVVHTSHDYYGMCLSSTMFKDGKNCEKICLSCRLSHKIKKSQSDHVTSFIAVSQFLADIYVKYGMFNRSHLNQIKNGNKLYSREAESSKIRGSVGFLGRITEEKGIFPFLDLARRSLETNKQFKFYIAGTGDQLFIETIKNQMPSNVKFLGKVDAIEYLSTIETLIVPSIWNDPLPTVIFEGFWMDCLVFGNKVGGISEMLDQKYIFDISEKNYLDDLLYRIEHTNFEQDLLRIIDKRNLYTEDRYCREYESVFMEALGESKVT